MGGTDARADSAVPYPIRVELTRLIESDSTRLGDVYRGLRRGLSADAIATELGVATSNFVWNYRAIADALLSGVVPRSPHIAKQASGRSRALRAADGLSGAARDHLIALETKLNQHAAGTRHERLRRDRDLVVTAGSSEPPSTARPTTPLVAVLHQQLRAIDRAIDADVLEYRGLVAVSDVERAFERLVGAGSAGSAFRELVAAGRPDLTLEQLALSLNDQISEKVRQTARDRLTYYSRREGHR